jgi:Tol biopolymer transport system component
MLIFGENKGRNMNTKLFFAFTFSLLFLGCPKDEECAICPPPVGGDSLVVTETFVTQGIHPAISPDGKKLAFSINGDIYICDTTGLNAKQLTSSTEYDMLPRWHPDGKTIGFVRNDGTTKNEGMLYTVDTNGVLDVLINKYPVADSLIVWSSVTVPIWDWSPTGTSVAFLSKSSDSTFIRLFTYPEKVELKTIFTYAHFFGGHTNEMSGFSFSPSGTQIVFTALGNDLYSYLYKTTVNTDTSKQLIANTSFAEFPSWTNQEDLFSAAAGSVPMNIFNSNNQIVQQLHYVWRNPKWSPDGKYILSEAPGHIGGANGYYYSKLKLTDISQDKDYNLTNEGDDGDFISIHNYFFVWDKSSKLVYFEKFKRIWKVSFYKKTKEAL